MTMLKKGTTTSLIPFACSVDGIDYEYKATCVDGQVPSKIDFSVTRSGQILANGNRRPAEGRFYFETMSSVSGDELEKIQGQVNADLSEIVTQLTNS